MEIVPSWIASLLDLANNSIGLAVWLLGSILCVTRLIRYGSLRQSHGHALTYGV